MDFEFSLPNADRMKSFESRTGPMFAQVVSNLHENKSLTELRDKLLPRLVSGEIDVSDIEV